MFGKGKKEKDIQKVLEGLTPEEKQDLLEALKGDENNEQKGEDTSKDSTNGVDSDSANGNDEKVNEGATTSNDTNPADNDENTQEPNAIPVSEVMLKSDFQEYLNQFETRFKNLEDKNTALENQNKELTDKNTALAKENEDLKAKYENNSFGNYGNKANDDKNTNKEKENFNTYMGKFFK